MAACSSAMYAYSCFETWSRWRVGYGEEWDFARQIQRGAVQRGVRESGKSMQGSRVILMLIHGIDLGEEQSKDTGVVMDIEKMVENLSGKKLVEGH